MMNQLTGSSHFIVKSLLPVTGSSDFNVKSLLPVNWQQTLPIYQCRFFHFDTHFKSSLSTEC